MSDTKRVWAWVGVGIVVLAIIIWFVGGMSFHHAPPAAPTPVFAPQGELVPQFPKNLILDENARVSGSYSIGYASSTNQYTAEYDSSSTVTSLYNMYTSYLPANGWTITGSLTTHPTFDAIAASDGSDQLQVVISASHPGSQVTITYVER